jgi:hypothetical protein
MSEETPKTDKPVTKIEERDVELPDEALDKVVGGDISMGQRGSNDNNQH